MDRVGVRWVKMNGDRISVLQFRSVKAGVLTQRFVLLVAALWL